jgi:PAS domain S-box-containing protein
MVVHRELFPGKTRMHASMREFDWNACGFGPPDTWPRSLLAIVDLMLDSAIPMCLAWGPSLRLLYNDAYLPIVAAKHPAALGSCMQDVCPEVWRSLEPIMQQARAGERGSLQNFPVDEVRYGRPSPRWFTLAFAPVHDDEGGVAGVMCIAHETTEQVLMERRHAFQLRLADRLRGLSDVDEITAHACRLLGSQLGVARVSFMEVDEGAGTLHPRRDWTAGELPALADLILPAERFGAAGMAQLRAGRALRVNDLAAGENLDAASHEAPVAARCRLAVPVFRRGALCAVLQVEGTQAHAWREDEVGLAEETAERTWASVERALADERRRLAEQELHRNAARQAFQLEVSDLLRPLTDPDAIIAAASDLLGRRLGVSRVLYAEVDDASGTFVVQRDWRRAGVTSVAGRNSRLDDFGPEIIAALRSGSTVAVDDIARDARTAPHADAYASVGVRSFVTVPLVKAGRLTIVLILHREEPYYWRELDLQRTQDLAERTWSAVEAARAQAALRAERDRSQYILDSMAEGFALLDPEARLTQVNAEGLRIGQLAAAEALGRRVCDIWPKAADSALATLYRQVKGTGRAASLEYKRHSPGVGPAWIEVRAYPVLDGGMAVFYRDIDQRKQAEEKLKDADRRKDEFVATLAHELRNPIAPIAAAAELLSLPGVGPKDLKRTGEVISRQVGHMNDLVNDLLDVSRITSGVMQLQLGEIDVNEIVPEALEQVQPLLESRGHQLEVALAPVRAPVYGDRHRLVQVLANLLNNAAKYTPDGGHIQVRVELLPEAVVLAVLDDGIGMSPAMVEAAFELFAQAERTSERTQGGLGIGLALVKGLVKLHGGEISAFSPGPGMGSEFRIVLPRLVAAAR